MKNLVRRVELFYIFAKFLNFWLNAIQLDEMLKVFFSWNRFVNDHSLHNYLVTSMDF